MPTGQAARVVCVSVVAGNYRPAARVFAASYRRHHPGHEVVVALLDAAPGLDETVEGVHWLGPQAFGLDSADLARMATAYTLTELATAVKPFLLRELRRRAEVVVYLDPDMVVYQPLDDVVELARERGVVLTPHLLDPLPRDGKEPDEAVIMGTGIFNLGFVAVGPGSAEFLDFWAQRLRTDAVMDPEHQLFTDQRWVDQVPGLFEHAVLRDPGFDVAYWNLGQRPVSRDADGTWRAGEAVLRVFHFSGYRPERPWLLTSHCARDPRTVLSAHPPLRALCGEYRDALLAAGYPDTAPYRYAAAADGTVLTPVVRRLFREAWVRAEAAGIPPPPTAFDADGGAAFRAWLAAPADPGQAVAGLGRWAYALWERRADLRAAFPAPLGRHAAAFRAWCEHSAPSEEGLASWALPVPPPPVPPPADKPGVNLLGYLTAELGLGEMGRIVHDALRAGGVPVACAVEEATVSNRTGLPAPASTGEPRFPVSLVCVNADQTATVLAAHPAVATDRYRIGLWAWELEEFPEWQHSAFGLLDEVWTVSRFCADAFARHSPIPVRVLPVPVRDPGPVRLRERCPGEPVTFLFTFDYNSVGERKNPWGLVEAFRRAFSGRDDARLVLKAINAGKHPCDAERLRVLVADEPRVSLLERYLSVEELEALYAGADCYVSLHRSEGFGLTVAEAMARGLPVVATDYSGTAEFLDAATGWPVPYTMVPVPPGCPPYQPGALWAEPDLDAAAAALRQVADDPVEARRRGAAAREHVLRTRPMGATAAWLAQAVEQARERWRTRRPMPAAADDEDPLAPLARGRQALHWRPEVDAPSRLPGAPTLRRMVLRAVDHYDAHQRRVLGAVTDGVAASVGTLAARVDGLAARMAAAAAAHPGLGPRLAALERTLDRLRVVLPADLAAAVGADLGELDALHGELAELREELTASVQAAFEARLAADRRADVAEAELARTRREVDALLGLAARVAPAVPADAVAVVCDAGVLALPADDEVVRPWLEYHRGWEPAEAELMARLAGAAGGVYLDLGAHVGYHVLRVLQRCPGLPRVVAVEANPRTVELLAHNVAANLPAELAGRVDVLAVAAWDAAGTVTLVHADPANSGDHRVTAAGCGITVPAVRLEDEPAVRKQRLGLVKSDLQGRDHRALAGLAGLLCRDRPHVVCEFSPETIKELGDDPVDVLAGYRALSYRLRDLDGAEQADDRATAAAAAAADSGFLTLWLDPGR